MKTIKFKAYRTLEIEDEIKVEDDATSDEIATALTDHISNTPSNQFDDITDDHVNLESGEHIYL